MSNADVHFNIRSDKQPEGGFSAVIVFEPMPTEEECSRFMLWLSEQLRDGLGWECGRTQ